MCVRVFLTEFQRHYYRLNFAIFHPPGSNLASPSLFASPGFIMREEDVVMLDEEHNFKRKRVL